MKATDNVTLSSDRFTAEFTITHNGIDPRTLLAITLDQLENNHLENIVENGVEGLLTTVYHGPRDEQFVEIEYISYTEDNPTNAGVIVLDRTTTNIEIACGATGQLLAVNDTHDNVNELIYNNLSQEPPRELSLEFTLVADLFKFTVSPSLELWIGDNAGGINTLQLDESVIQDFAIENTAYKINENLSEFLHGDEIFQEVFLLVPIKVIVQALKKEEIVRLSGLGLLEEVRIFMCCNVSKPEFLPCPLGVRFTVEDGRS